VYCGMASSKVGDVEGEGRKSSVRLFERGNVNGPSGSSPSISSVCATEY